MTPLRIAARAVQRAEIVMRRRRWACRATPTSGADGRMADGGCQMGRGVAQNGEGEEDGCEGQPGQSSASTAPAWARLVLVAAIKDGHGVVPALAAGNGRVSVHLCTSPLPQPTSQPATACPVPESGAFLHLPLKTPPALPSYPLPPPLIAAVLLLALAAQSLILCPCRSFATTTLAVTHTHSFLSIQAILVAARPPTEDAPRPTATYSAHAALKTPPPLP
jgi:hypothetical protein